MKLLISLIMLVSSIAFANPPVIWNGVDAKFINSGTIIVPGVGSAGVCKVNGSGSFSSNATTSDLSEGTNLYFTNARAKGAVSASSPLVDTGGVFSIPVATSSVNGYLSSTDWNTFNNKQASGSYVLTTRNINTSSPLIGGGDLSADRTISIPAATSSVNGYLTSTDWATFNGKENALTFNSPLSRSTNTISIPQSSSSVGGYLSQTDWSTFNNKAGTVSPAFTGIPTAPTASIGTSTTQLATTAFVLSQGFIGASGAMPVASSTSLVTTTSASTTFVNALTTTITITAASAPVRAMCVLDMTSATSASVATVRVTINGVSGGSVTESLTTATTQHLTVANQAQSASLTAGTYTVNCDFNRASGTGTVTVGQGSLTAVGLQGSTSNGITQLTGALQAGPGSGSQVLSGVLPVANGGTALSSTTINQILYSSANNVVGGLATTNTGALVTSSSGVPSITSGATANRLLRTNGTTVSFAQAALATDVSGTLPVANGGTGLTSAFASGRVMYSNGSTLAADSLLIYDATNNRFTVGNGGTSRLSAVVQPTDVQPNDTALNVYSRGTTKSAMNLQNENTLFTLDMTNSGGPTLGASIEAESSRGTLASRTQSQTNDILFTLTSHGHTGSGYSTGLSSSIQMVSTENVTNTNNGGDIVLSTTPNGGSAVVENVRITQEGLAKFKHGTMIDTSVSQPTCDVSHRGTWWVIQGGVGVADILQICLKNAADVYVWTTK